LGGAFSSLGKKVLLVDGNFSAPNLGLHFNIIEPTTTLHHVMTRQIRPSEAVYELDDFHLIPASTTEKMEFSPLKLKDRINYLRKGYDVIILDSSPSLDEETLGVMLASDEILVVATPDKPTLSNTLRAIKLAVQRGTPISGLILNKVYDKDFEISLKDIEDTIEVPIMAVIPHDIDVLRALSKGKASTLFKPKSRASEEYRRLAAVLVGEKPEKNKLRKIFGWVNPKKQEVNRTLYYNRVFK